LAAQHAVAEAMTKAFLQKCNNCQLPFVKEEGCNMITCSCENIQCFVCSQNIDGHDHFGYGDEDCPLFDNTRVRQRRAVATAQEEAVQVRLEMDGALTEDDLLIDPNLRNLDEEQLANDAAEELNFPHFWGNFGIMPLWQVHVGEELERLEIELREELEEREREERERAEAAEQAHREAERIRQEAEAERPLRENSQKRREKRDRKRMTRARQTQEHIRQSKIGWARTSGSQKRVRHR
jgi:hypothetical protein